MNHGSPNSECHSIINESKWKEFITAGEKSFRIVRYIITSNSPNYFSNYFKQITSYSDFLKLAFDLDHGDIAVSGMQNVWQRIQHNSLEKMRISDLQVKFGHLLKPTLVEVAVGLTKLHPTMSEQFTRLNLRQDQSDPIMTQF